MVFFFVSTMVFKSNTEVANILQENIYNTKGLLNFNLLKWVTNHDIVI